jgi:hypothetical protein
VRRFFISSFGLVVAALVSGAYVGAAAQESGKRNTNNLKATLNGVQEVPAVSTVGKGKLDLVIDEAAQTIDFELSYQDLEGIAPATPDGVVLFSHIHFGRPSTTGGVSVFFCGGGGFPACPASGTITGVITPANVVGPAGQGIAPGEFGELLRALRNQDTYVNVHTTKHPGGEIRGRIK